MREFIEEYGAVIVISLVGYAVMSGLWSVLMEVSRGMA